MHFQRFNKIIKILYYQWNKSVEQNVSYKKLYW